MAFTTLGSSFLGAIDGTDRFQQQQKAEQDLKLNALKLDAERRKTTIELQAAQDAPNLARWVTAPATPPGQASMPMGGPPQPYSPPQGQASMPMGGPPQPYSPPQGQASMPMGGPPQPYTPPQGQASMPMGGPPQPYKSVVASAQPTPVNTAQTYSGPPALSQQPPRVTLAGMVEVLQAHGVPEDRWLGAMEKLIPFMDREDTYRVAEIKAQMEQQFHEDTVRNQGRQFDLQNRQLNSNEANQALQYELQGRQLNSNEANQALQYELQNRREGENKRHNLANEAINVQKNAQRQTHHMSTEELHDLNALTKFVESEFGVNEEALKRDILSYNRGLPLQGVGKSKDAQRYLTYVKDAAAIVNPGADINGNNSNYTAISKSLNDRVKYSNTIDQFSGNLKKQIELVKQYVNAGVGVDYPLLSGIQQKVREKLLGSDEVTNFKNLINTLRDEHQKIILGSTGAAGLSVSAQETGKEILNENMSLRQIQGVLKTMQEEAANADANAKSKVEELSKELYAIGRPKGNAETSDRTSDDVAHSPDGGAVYTFPNTSAGRKAFDEAKLPPGTVVRFGDTKYIIKAKGAPK